MSIEAKHIKVSYGNYTVIHDESVHIPEGKITMLIGENGCGKSTLLKAMARILTPNEGEVCIDGQNIRKITEKKLAQKMALLPQNPLVPEGISVQELVGYGRFPYQKPFQGLRKEDYEIMTWAMKKTGFYELKDKLVDTLSGGQRQRVFIAMALAQKTKILLLDEPTTFLDMAHQLEILELLKELNEEEQVTIVMVIHELNHACKFADYIIGMKKGSILFQGDVHSVIHKENLRELYHIDAVLMQHEEKGYPICADYELSHE